MKSHQYIWQNPKWPDFTWDSSKILEPLGKSRMAQGKLLESIKGLGLELLVSAHAEILTEEAIKTSSIEGEHINHASVRSSVARKLGLPTAGLPADRNAEGPTEFQSMLRSALSYSRLGRSAAQRARDREGEEEATQRRAPSPPGSAGRAAAARLRCAGDVAGRSRHRAIVYDV